MESKTCLVLRAVSPWVPTRRGAYAALHDGPSVCHDQSRPQEPGARKTFDFSAAALTERWSAGFTDMMQAKAGLRSA